MSLLDDLKVIKTILCTESDFPKEFNPLDCAIKFSVKDLLDKVLLDTGTIRDEGYYLNRFKKQSISLDAEEYKGNMHISTYIKPSRLEDILENGIEPTVSPYARVIPIELFRGKDVGEKLKIDVDLTHASSLVISHGIIFSEHFPKECFSLSKEVAE